jgi:hypothetical protein
MASSYDSDLAKKLNVKSGMRVRVLARPDGIDLTGLTTTDAADAEAQIVFVRTLAEAEELGDAAVLAARAGKVTWMAYPKARQLGTDLNRDILWKFMQGKGIEANRQIALDDTWSAMRFRAGA